MARRRLLSTVLPNNNPRIMGGMAKSSLENVTNDTGGQHKDDITEVVVEGKRAHGAEG